MTTQLYKEEIQRVGDAIGLKGEFTVNWGTDHMIQRFKNTSSDIARAVEMLGVAADYIRRHCPDELIHYDEADCDGGCVADDCDAVADSLKTIVFENEGHTPHCAARRYCPICGHTEWIVLGGGRVENG